MPTPLHQRKMIRDAVIAALVAANTDAGTRVYATRMEPGRTAELPLISVYLPSESNDLEYSRLAAPRELKRDVDVVVEAWVRLASELQVEDEFDAIALQVERAMNADPTFGDVASDSVYSGTETGMKMTGDRPIGAVQITYSFRYFTNAPEDADATPPDALVKVDTKYNLGNAVDPRNELEDTVTEAQ